MVIVENDAEPPELVARDRQRSLENVHFQPLQPIERMSELLATADVSVIPQKRAVTDIMLAPKLCNIVASTQPVVAAAPPTSALATAPSRGVALAANDRRYAEEFLLQGAVIGRFEATALSDGR